MLIDKRSILKEAQAKAAAKNVPAAGGNNRMATKKTSAKAEKAAEATTQTPVQQAPVQTLPQPEPEEIPVKEGIQDEFIRTVNEYDEYE